ncbi:hypothetical protein TNCT_535841 [Trichonephila clavata]|uniref:Uncharacterized protein n=1 Tax=Trichonephila clavata TaxID=2740835 RepID=A0A8X6L631_TRICU|nr:hypothetical protein TNCT_535841 [Trichonephila clavata]
MSSDRWYQKPWKSFTSLFRVGEQEPFPNVDMSDCMEGKPLSDTSLQDCLFNPPLSINPLEKPLPVYPKTWPLERLKGKPIFLQLPCENQIIYERYWNRMSLSCIPEEEESTRSTKVDLKDSRENSNLKDCRDNSKLKDSRDNSNLKDSRDNSNLKDSRDNSNLKDSRDNSNLKDCRDNSNLKDSRDNSNLKDCRDNSNLKNCMGSSKEEPESILDAYIRKRNERLECKLKNPECEGCSTVWIS